MPPPSDAVPSPSSYWRTDRAPGGTRLANVVSGVDRETILGCAGCVARLSLASYPRVYGKPSCSRDFSFDLNIVYTNMSGVTNRHNARPHWGRAASAREAWARRIECHLWRVSFCFFSLSFVGRIGEKGVRSGSPATTTYVGLGLYIVMSKIHYCCFQKGP